jgi:hypothetical protein
LLLDESIVNPGESPETLKISETKDILSNAGIKQVAKFGFLTVYDTGFGNQEVTAPTLSFENPKTPVISLGQPEISEDLSINRGYPEAHNCDLKLAGSVSKTNSQNGILYTAREGGASCDFLIYPDLRYDKGYYLRIAGENRAGRSLKVYLFNTTTQFAELEEILPAGKFDKTFVIYPGKVVGQGYSLNFETRSFGRIPSENLLTKVEFYSVNTLNVQGETLHVDNNLKISGVKKYGTWAYKIEIENSDREGLLELGQGFENGWVAIQFPDLGLKSLSQISNLKILEHTKINSWANGWTVPQCQMINGKCQIFILYRTQLLEWGGGILGLAALIVLAFKKLDRK